MRRVSGLVPYARNARTHSPEQVAKIMSSIREWGWTTPVLVDEEDNIIAGHGRVLAAHRLNIETVPVVVARGWTRAQCRAYCIADNKLSIDAQWDPDILDIELADLVEDKFDLDLTGFSAAEIDELRALKAVSELPEVDLPRLDQATPVMVVCPSCGHEFNSKA